MVSLSSFISGFTGGPAGFSRTTNQFGGSLSTPTQIIQNAPDPNLKFITNPQTTDLFSRSTQNIFSNIQDLTKENQISKTSLLNTQNQIIPQVQKNIFDIGTNAANIGTNNQNVGTLFSGIKDAFGSILGPQKELSKDTGTVQSGENQDFSKSLTDGLSGIKDFLGPIGLLAVGGIVLIKVLK